MSYYHDRIFNSAREFIDFFLRDDLFRTTTRFHANLTGSGGMIFRGQSDSDWPLLPSAFRPKAFECFTPQPPSERMQEESRRRYLARHLHAEGRSIFIFLEEADRLGLVSPIDYTTLHEDNDLLQAAIKDDPEFDYGRSFPSDSFHRATALAQHHGVPTRFLDWSESPLVASYFAACGVSSIGTRPRPEQQIAVYYLSTFSLSKTPVQVVLAPRHENPFLRQQQGLFTNQRNANEHFLDVGAWPSLDSVPSLQIYRARLSARDADDLLRELFDLGITRHSLMPSLTHAASAYSYTKALFE